MFGDMEKKMSELDPDVMSKIYDSVLSQIQRTQLTDSGSHLDQLSKHGLVTDKERQTLQAILSKAHSQPAPSRTVVAKEIDAVLSDGNVKSPVAEILLKTIRFLDNTQSAPEQPGQLQQNLLSIPDVEWDPAAASDGIVEGGAGGAVAGAAIGGVPGAIFGAAVGGVIGGLIKGFGHGAQGGGGKK
jgi:hypothetical protein